MTTATLIKKNTHFQFSGSVHQHNGVTSWHAVKHAREVTESPASCSQQDYCTYINQELYHINLDMWLF